MRRGIRRGGSLKSWLKKANTWLRGNKVISRVGNTLGSLGVPYASNVGNIAGKLGYGRGRGLTPTGGALRLAGMGRRISMVRRRR